MCRYLELFKTLLGPPVIKFFDSHFNLYYILFPMHIPQGSIWKDTTFHLSPLV